MYVLLAGSGDLAMAGPRLELHPGRCVRVAANATRQVTAGPDGLTFIAVGAPQQGEYTGRPTL